MKVYQQLASLLDARLNCIGTGNTEWESRHETAILELVRDYLPSGAGIDGGVEIDLTASNGARLVFTFSYHHMNDAGYYDGWTHHRLTVTPAFTGINMRISGPNRNEVKDYLADTFDIALQQEVKA
jgi:hypothetical protein